MIGRHVEGQASCQGLGAIGHLTEGVVIQRLQLFPENGPLLGGVALLLIPHHSVPLEVKRKPSPHLKVGVTFSTFKHQRHLCSIYAYI